MLAITKFRVSEVRKKKNRLAPFDDLHICPIESAANCISGAPERLVNLISDSVFPEMMPCFSPTSFPKFPEPFTHVQQPKEPTGVWTEDLGFVF